VGRLAFNVILMNLLKWVESTAFVFLFSFYDFLQAKLAITISQRKELILFACGLIWGLFRIGREWVKFDQQRIERDIKKEELKKIKNGLD
jgi:hypothetical protein